MCSVRITSVVAALAALSVPSLAEPEVTISTGRPQREYTSADGRLTLRVERGRPGRSAARSCRATLMAREAGEGESGVEKPGPRWERPLVNEGSPVAAAIRNDGRFVVTLGEAPRGRLQNALVIYGDRGQLLRHFLLSDLLSRDDWRHVDLQARSRGADWLKDARLEFIPEPEQFVATLAWGREVRVDLKSLRLVRAAGEASDDELPPDVLAMLSGDAERAEHAADDVQGESLADAAMDEVTQDAVDTLVVGPDGEAQVNIQAAIEALDTGALAPRVVFEFADGKLTIRNENGDVLQQIAPVEIRDAEDQSGEHPERDGAGMMDAPAGVAEVDVEGARDVPDAFRIAPGQPDAPEDLAPLNEPYADFPAPDPGQHTDYMAWLNGLSRVDGPSAAPLYDLAAEKVVRYEGDRALLDAAMRGDAEALRSPEIAAWIESNRAAVEDIRAATKLEYRGYELKSENGDLISAMLPNLSPVREATRAMIAGGRQAQAEGRVADAVTDYLDAARVGAQTGQGHTLIESLVGVAIQSAANNAILDLAASASAGEVDFDAIASELEQAGAPRPPSQTMQAERVMFLDSTQRLFERDPNSGEVRPSPQGIQQFLAYGASSGDDPTSLSMAWNLAGANFDETIAEGNAYYDRIAAAAALPYQEGRAALREVEASLTQATANPVLRSLLPAFSRSQFIRTRGEAERRGAVTVARIRAFEQRNGRLPESLDELGASPSFVDPFTNTSFRYERTGDGGFRLYSLGDNGQDDGGVHDQKAETGDFVIWPRQPQK